MVVDGTDVDAGVIDQRRCPRRLSSMPRPSNWPPIAGSVRGQSTWTASAGTAWSSFQPTTAATSIVAGLPIAEVDATMLRVLVIFCVVAVVALVAAATRGHRHRPAPLAPLRGSRDRQQVADLPLDRGEVELPVRVVQVDPPHTRTEVGQLGSAR